MSHSEHYTDTGPTTAFYQGVEAGKEAERKRIVELIKQTYEDASYKELGSLEWTGDIIELIEKE